MVAIPTVVVTTATVTRMPPIDHVDHIDHAVVVVDEVEAMAVEDVMITIIIDPTIIQCAIVEVVHPQYLMAVVLVPGAASAGGSAERSGNDPSFGPVPLEDPEVREEGLWDSDCHRQHRGHATATADLANRRRKRKRPQ